MVENALETFGHRLRVRVCGVLLHQDKILMACHKSLTKPNAVFWCPPGGGVEYGESVSNALIREFQEETGLVVRVKSTLTNHEFLAPPLHAIELFMEVIATENDTIVGKDPEISDNAQLLIDMRFMTLPEIKQLAPLSYHRIFDFVETLEDLHRLPRFIAADDKLSKI